jgi:hypothetical protein
MCSIQGLRAHPGDRLSSSFEIAEIVPDHPVQIPELTLIAPWYTARVDHFDDNITTGCYESHWNDSRCIRATAVITVRLPAIVVVEYEVATCNIYFEHP